MDRKHFEECKPAIEEAARCGLEHFRRPDPGSDTDNDAANSEQHAADLDRHIRPAVRRQAAVDAPIGPA